MDWVRRNLAFFHPGLRTPRVIGRPGLESIPAMARWIVDKNPGRGLYFGYNRIEDGTFPGVRMVPYGLVEKGFLPGGEPPVLDEDLADAVWKGLRLRHMEAPKFPQDRRTRKRVIRDYGVFRNTLGIYEEGLGDALINLPSMKKRKEALGHYERSYRSFKWTEAWDPKNAEYACNLGNACVHLNREEKALDWYRQSYSLDPKYKDAYLNAAVVCLRMEKNGEARSFFTKVLDLDPENAEARRGMEVLGAGPPLPVKIRAVEGTP
jgi:Tetratricopeptide repeat